MDEWMKDLVEKTIQQDRSIDYLHLHPLTYAFVPWWIDSQLANPSVSLLYSFGTEDWTGGRDEQIIGWSSYTQDSGLIIRLSLTELYSTTV